MTKKEDVQGYGLIKKPKDEVKKKEPLRMEVEVLIKQYPSLVVEVKLEELPRIRSISHQTDIVLGATLPNKPTYKLTP